MAKSARLIRPTKNRTYTPSINTLGKHFSHGLESRRQSNPFQSIYRIYTPRQMVCAGWFGSVKPRKNFTHDRTSAVMPFTHSAAIRPCEQMGNRAPPFPYPRLPAHFPHVGQMEGHWLYSALIFWHNSINLDDTFSLKYQQSVYCAHDCHWYTAHTHTHAQYVLSVLLLEIICFTCSKSWAKRVLKGIQTGLIMIIQLRDYREISTAFSCPPPPSFLHLWLFQLFASRRDRCKR